MGPDEQERVGNWAVILDGQEWIDTGQCPGPEGQRPGKASWQQLACAAGAAP